MFNQLKSGLKWYPGHMKKARFLIKKNLEKVDVVFELLDSRAPFATRNLGILDIVKGKLRIVVLGKSDLADSNVTKLWTSYFKEKEDIFAISVDCRNFKQTRKLVDISFDLLRKNEIKNGKKNIRAQRFRAMVVGIPNVGKSTLINSLVGRKKAKSGDFPGVTTAEQWVSLGENIDLLDMPGSLYSEDKTEENRGILELIGAIKGGDFCEEEAAFSLLNFLKLHKESIVKTMFGESWVDDCESLLRFYGVKKAFLKKGGAVDVKRAAIFLVKEFRKGKFGRLSLQLPPL